jgi:hypothetical protein
VLVTLVKQNILGGGYVHSEDIFGVPRLQSLAI